MYFSYEPAIKLMFALLSGCLSLVLRNGKLKTLAKRGGKVLVLAFWVLALKIKIKIKINYKIIIKIIKIIKYPLFAFKKYK